MPKTKPARDEIEAVARGAVTSFALTKLYEIKAVYSHEVDCTELTKLLAECLDELEAATQHPVWQKITQLYDDSQVESKLTRPVLSVIQSECGEDARETGPLKDVRETLGVVKESLQGNVLARVLRKPDVTPEAASMLVTVLITVAVCWLEEVIDVTKQLFDYINVRVFRTLSHVKDIHRFKCHFPDPSTVPEYGLPGRFLFLFGEYWKAYSSLLQARAACLFIHDSGTFAREITELKYRIEHCVKQISDYSDSQDCFNQALLLDPISDEDFQATWVRQGERLTLECEKAVEQLKVKLGDRRFALTLAERSLIESAEDKVRFLKGQEDLAWIEFRPEFETLAKRHALSRPSSNSSGAVQGTEETKPGRITPEPKLSHAEEKEFECCGFNSRLSIVVTGDIEEQCTHVVLVGGRRALLANRPFTVFLRLVRELSEGKDGYVTTEELMKDNVVRSKTDSNRMASDLRKALQHALEGKIDKSKFIQTPRLMMRLSTHSRYIDYSRLKAKPLKQFDPEVREQIRKLP